MFYKIVYTVSKIYKRRNHAFTTNRGKWLLCLSFLIVKPSKSLNIHLLKITKMSSKIYLFQKEQFIEIIINYFSTFCYGHHLFWKTQISIKNVQPHRIRIKSVTTYSVHSLDLASNNTNYLCHVLDQQNLMAQKNIQGYCNLTEMSVKGIIIRAQISSAKKLMLPIKTFKIYVINS